MAQKAIPEATSQSASGLFIVAFLAEGFPVGLIPEQPLVSPVRNNVIHDGRRDDLCVL